MRLQHIQEVLERLPTAELRQAFSEVEEEKFRKLQQELDTFIDKSDYRNREPLAENAMPGCAPRENFPARNPLAINPTTPMNATNIKSITAREALDSRGNPTVSAEVHLKVAPADRPSSHPGQAPVSMRPWNCAMGTRSVTEAKAS